MKTEITFSNLFGNVELRQYFFRQQALDTLNEVESIIIHSPEAMECVNEFCEVNFDTIDEMEEYFYETDACEISGQILECHPELEEGVMRSLED